MKTPLALGIAGALGAMAGFVAGDEKQVEPTGDLPGWEAVSIRLCAQEMRKRDASNHESKAVPGTAVRF